MGAKNLILTLIFTSIAYATQINNNLFKKTEALEGIINIYERAKNYPESMRVPKGGLWTKIDLGLWHYYNEFYALADSFIREDLKLIYKYGEEYEEEPAFGGTKSIDYLLLGQIAIQQKNFEEAFNNTSKAKEEFDKIGHKRGIAKCHHVDALNYKAQGKYDLVLIELAKGLKIAEKHYDEEKNIFTLKLIQKIKKEIGNILKITGEEFQEKNCYEWWTETY